MSNLCISFTFNKNCQIKKDYCTTMILVFLMWSSFMIFPEDSTTTTTKIPICYRGQNQAQCKDKKPMCMNFGSKLKPFLAKHGNNIPFQTTPYSKDKLRHQDLQYLESLCVLVYNINHQYHLHKHKHNFASQYYYSDAVDVVLHQNPHGL